MTGAQYIVYSLIRRQVTDAFGIPGGVILRLIYEMDNRRDEIVPHLSYHEQAAGFAACGYAQASGKLGVAYATRGPGFTNLISAIADAYYDSLPTLFITAHAAPCPPLGMRALNDQEMDTCTMVRNITKVAIRVDNSEELPKTFEQICDTALTGRKGPVFLDIASSILSQKIVSDYSNIGTWFEDESIEEDIKRITDAIDQSKRPVILAGDGINQAGAREIFERFVHDSGMPVISSRFSHDVVQEKKRYFGYVGSHGIRCANFILSKTDLIISLGNRLHFPPHSETFGDVLNHTKLIRCEIDEGEYQRIIPNTLSIRTDVASLLAKLTNRKYDRERFSDWMHVCEALKSELSEEDMNGTVRSIAEILKRTPSDFAVVNDVGNNEFWVSRASVYAESKHRTYYSKSFGALGCALGKAIGVYYATRKPVLCFVGDQGLQMNIQELQFISQHRLPIIIVLLNNAASGMIKDREAVAFDRFLHTTMDSGFTSPNFEKIALAYNMGYQQLVNNYDVDKFMRGNVYPVLVELRIDEEMRLTPNLPRGVKCQDMEPALPREKYNSLNQL